MERGAPAPSGVAESTSFELQGLRENEPLLFGIGGFVLGSALAAAILAFRRRPIRTGAQDRGLREIDESTRLRDILHTAPFPMMVLDSEAHFLRMNPKGEEAFGYAPGEWSGKSWSDHLHPEDWDKLMGMFSLRITNKRHRPAPLKMRSADGSWRWYQGWSHGYETESGELRLLAAAWDISAEHEAAETLRASEERFRNFADHSPDLIAEYDEEGRFTYANPAWQIQLGHAPEWLVGKSSFSLGVSEDHPRMRNELKRAMCRETKQPNGWTRYRLRDADGDYHWMDIGGATYRNSRGQRRLVATLRDVTLQVDREAGLERFAGLLDRSHDAVVMMDAGGQISFLNQSGRRLVGMHPDAPVSGTSIGDLVPQEYGSLLMELVLPALVRDGEFSGTFALSHQETKDWVPVQLEGVAIPDPAQARGIVVGLILRDLRVEQRLRTEREELTAQLDAFERLESLRVVVGGIAHDFNNLLAIILGNVSMARNEAREPHRDVLLSSAEDAAARVTDVVTRLLAYVGEWAGENRRFNLEEVAQQASSSNTLALASGTTILRQLNGPTPSLAGDPRQVRQMIDHMLENAIEAVAPRGGTISLRTDAVALQREDIARLHLPLHAIPGRFASLEIRDSGPGIDPDVLQKAFDPFFSTKAIGRGLGLAAAMGIVRQAGGAIDLESRPGDGTTIRIFLPAADDVLALGSDLPRASAKHTGTVLVLEEEPELLRLLQHALEIGGYTVVTATTSEDAIDELRHLGTNLATAVLGLQLPVARGLAVLAELRRASPGLPVIVSTTHGEEALVRELIGRTAHVLVKPYGPDALLALIETIRLIESNQNS